VRNYLDWILSIPWKKRTKVRRDIKAAQKVLDEDHFGLEKVKERILEYLAVQQRQQNLRARSCVWWARLALVKPRSANPSPRLPAVTSCVCRLAACGMKPKSAPSPDLYRLDARQDFARHEEGKSSNPCSCWMKLTNSAPIGAAIHLQLCWKCWIPNRTTLSTIIIWKWIMIFRM